MYSRSGQDDTLPIANREGIAFFVTIEVLKRVRGRILWIGSKNVPDRLALELKQMLPCKTAISLIMFRFLLVVSFFHVQEGDSERSHSQA